MVQNTHPKQQTAAGKINFNSKNIILDFRDVISQNSVLNPEEINRINYFLNYNK